MVSFWKFFLDNRAFTYFLILMTFLSGLYAINTIPKESTPDITIPIAVVSTPFFGASATDVELLVTKKIEQQVSNLSDVKTYTSTSNSGFSSVVIEFEQSADIDERVTRLKEQIDQIKNQLPRDGNEPQVTKIEFSSQPIFMVSLVSDLPFYLFQQIVDTVEEELLKIEGVAGVTYSGIPEREISVVVDNRRLIQSGVDFNAVSRLLGGSNITQSAGSLTIGTLDYPLDIKAEVSSFSQLQNMPIGQSGVSSLVISDIATLYNGYRDRDTIAEVGFPGGETMQAVTIYVTKKNGGDITRLTAQVRETLDRLGDTTLDGVDYVVTYDAGKDINYDLLDLTRSGAQTVVLVFFILLLFVGLRESIIAALSIPLSFMMAFVAFLFVGNTINFISLFALILSIGILVDSAIVVVEGINSKISEGMRRQDAAVATIREFGIPLFAGTMTTVAVFFPLLFLSGIIGQFIRGIPYTVIFVLMASMFVSLGFVTVLCASFLKNRDAVQKEHKENWLFARLTRLYRQLLTYFLHHAIPRRLFQVVITLSVVLSFMLVVFGFIKVEFFPGGDLEYAYISIEMDPGTPLSDTAEFTKRVQNILLDKPYIESFVSTVGQTSPYDENSAASGEHYANITLNILKDFQSHGVSLLDDVQGQLGESGYEHAELVAQGGGPPGGAAIDVSFSGSDDNVLRSSVRIAEDILGDIDGPINIATSLSGNNTGFDIIIDRNAAYRYGVSISDISNVIRGATDGIELFDITTNGEDVPVFIRNRLDFTGDSTIVTKNITPDMLSALSVGNARGENILLGTIITAVLSESDVVIHHTDGDRVVDVTAAVDEGYNNGEVRQIFEDRLKQELPDGVQYSFGGEQSEQDDSFAEVGLAFVAGVFLMFSILILQFGRWRQVLIIMSVLPYALAGVLLGLYVSGNTLSFPAMLGLIALTGIVVNNSIILVSVFNQLRQKNPEWDINTVVTEGSVQRLRPIILTTITTIVGVMPLLAASGIWAPIAYAIIFGLTFCILVTLVMVPMLYRRFEGFSVGPWSNVISWVINFVVILLVPLVVVGIMLFIGSRLHIHNSILLYSAALGSIALAYILTHIRRHH